MKDVFIGLGSNLGGRKKNIEQGLEILGGRKGVIINARSPLYLTRPVGEVEQDDFINAAARLETDLSAEQLLTTMLGVEAELGRKRTEKWGPRTLDLDLLFYGTEIIDGPGLMVPHPELHKRRFVLRPLCDLAPDFTHPRLGRTMAQLLADLEDDGGVTRLED